jgi:hypothetical protein
MQPETRVKPRVRTKPSKFGPEPTSFDVTCVIGSVDITTSGPMTANEAAFGMIARHDRPGTYQFPGEAGTITVTVEHEQPQKLD